jgi:hypothetical protein
LQAHPFDESVSLDVRAPNRSMDRPDREEHTKGIG